MKCILCIDDEEDVLDTLNVILSDEYSVRTSSTPNNVFHLIQQHKPDLILMDINMEPFNGLEICKAIKSYITTENIPLIIISSDERIQ